MVIKKIIKAAAKKGLKSKKVIKRKPRKVRVASSRSQPLPHRLGSGTVKQKVKSKKLLLLIAGTEL